MAIVLADLSKPGYVVVGAAAVLLSMCVGATAQLFERGGPFLSEKDFTAAGTAARRLLEPQPAPTGASGKWSDAASGDSGTIVMGAASKRDGQDCRVLTFYDVFKSGSVRTVVVKTCRISGIWRLV